MNCQKKIQSTKTVVLVLHRVVTDEVADFEDVTVDILSFILSHPKKNILLTFDDGNSSDYEIVYPLLKKSGISAVFFIITDMVGKQGYLTWVQIREMSDGGMMFGSHSKSHRKMTTLTNTQMNEEITDSKTSLEKNIGEVNMSFSFPFGDYNRKLVNIVLASGYESCFISKHGVVELPAKIIPRNSINSSMSKSSVLDVLNASSWSLFVWMLEDRLKGIIKIIFGYKFYRFIRDKLS